MSKKLAGSKPFVAKWASGGSVGQLWGLMTTDDDQRHRLRTTADFQISWIRQVWQRTEVMRSDIVEGSRLMKGNECQPSLED